MVCGVRVPELATTTRAPSLLSYEMFHAAAEIVLGQARGQRGDERSAADERFSREEPSGQPSLRGRVYVDEIHVEAGLADCISGGSSRVRRR